MDNLNIFFISLLVFLVLGSCNGGELRKSFYRISCPEAENIVRNVTWKHVASKNSLPAKFIRMHFHDCFVRGCDGSVLLDSTSNNTAEKDAIPNKSLEGFDVIDEIKSQLEKTCPGVVSCADIVALATRDSVSFQFNRSMWEVLTGRRDGTISHASEALANIPSPFFNFTTLKQSFANKSLTVQDLVVLSGAHTIGVGHCNFFSNRLYNFTGKGDADPSLNSTYAATLRTKCQSLSDNTTTVEMDPGSSLTFDNHYFSILKQQQGIFQSDAALLTNKGASNIIDEMVSAGKFFTEFSQSMKRMGAIDVLTGTAGEIRKKCNVVNS
ncbi:Peroxidase 3 [Forsythia ovata]|uniref:Peroxidase n=1 Tax=Forsythia ovata TaxID=205694 RepID=A0ABD1V077_9LAMI